MKKTILAIIIAAVVIFLLTPSVYANSRKTWATVGKGLAIYEGVKVLTGREGNIIQDVTGGMKPARSSEQAPAASYEDGYNAGYKKGYDDGYNAGFRTGIEHDTAKK